VSSRPRAVEQMATTRAIVTGGGSGIGRAVALELAGKGVDTLVVGRNVNTLTKVAAENDKIRVCVADISTPEGRKTVKDSVGDAAIHVLIQNAAVLETNPLVSSELAPFQAAMATNVEAPVFLTQALLPNLEAAEGSARVLLVSSGVADMPIPGLGAYCASKAALKMLWKILAAECLPRGVHVGYCLPGLVDTGMPTHMAQADGFMLQGVMAERVKTGDIHPAAEIGQWMAKLVHQSPLDETVFRERVHDVDMPGHDMGVQLVETTEAKLAKASATPLPQSNVPSKELASEQQHTADRQRFLRCWTCWTLNGEDAQQ